MSTENLIISLKDLNKIYGEGELQVQALKDINITINAGEYCSIMGASGSGKSTLMNVIGCLDRPTTGQYILDSDNVANLDDRALAHIRNQKIGFRISAVSSIAPNLRLGECDAADGLCRY